MLSSKHCRLPSAVRTKAHFCVPTSTRTPLMFSCPCESAPVRVADRLRQTTPRRVEGTVRFRSTAGRDEPRFDTWSPPQARRMFGFPEYRQERGVVEHDHLRTPPQRYGEGRVQADADSHLQSPEPSLRRPKRRVAPCLRPHERTDPAAARKKM